MRKRKGIWRAMKSAARAPKPIPYSHGAASEVRHIDPATVQIPATMTATKRPPVSKKNALVKKADKLLRNDARHRFGKRAGDRAHARIKAGRFW